VGGFGDHDVTRLGISALLSIPIGGIPKIESSAFVVLGSGCVDSVAGKPFLTGSNEIPSVVGDSEGGGDLRGPWEFDGGVLDSGYGTVTRCSPPSRLSPDRGSGGHPLRLRFLVLVIVQIPEQVGGVHDVRPPEVVYLYAC